MKMFRVIPFINYYHNEYKVFKDIVIIKHIPHESTILPDGFKINEKILLCKINIYIKWLIPKLVNYLGILKESK